MDDDGVASPELPEWLPDGWIMKPVSRRDGSVERRAVALPTGISRYFIFAPFASYVSPVSGRTFRSRDEVLHYLDFESSDAVEAVKPSLRKLNAISPIWLPSGWILEIKTHKSGAKWVLCYFDLTSLTFISKKKKPPGVQPEEKHLCKSASDQKSISVDFRDDAIVETSPDGLPSSCIKEVKYGGNASHEDDPDGELAHCTRSGAVSEQLVLVTCVHQSGLLAWNSACSPFLLRPHLIKDLTL
ncbi:unnamed protein product [Spirodela intermedia]|uniref:MBD domain-containing protein n=1 Tax=Spirodela intermedia TaxID=51605 RepID=A0A7I8K9H7_SPIIN|nr:unnamed protein product [Spirodela intermedia]